MGFSCSLKRVRQEPQGMPMVVRVRDPRPKLRTQDWFWFLATMRQELVGELEKYREFMAIMREFKAGGLVMIHPCTVTREMNTASVVDHVMVLLAGHPDLIRAFNEFLPWDYIRSPGPAVGSSI